MENKLFIPDRINVGLQGLEKRLDALVSPEMKRDLELKQIEKLLGE